MTSLDTNTPLLFGENESAISPFLDSSVLQYYPKFLDQEQSREYFQILKDTINWKHEQISLFGKKVLQPRFTALYGETDRIYRYSGLTMKPSPWTQELLEIKNLVEEYTPCRFNTVLLNYYRSGLDSMGWHADNESELGYNPIIASVSFGAERKFILRLNTNHSIKKTLFLSNGSLLIMGGNLQHTTQHSLPKQSAVINGRINLTFRKIS